MRKGIDLYGKAIDIDPHYALAYASMAYVLMMLPITCDVPPSDVFPKAKAAAKRALQLDDSLGEAHQSQGWVHFWCDYDWVNSEKEFRRTLELDLKQAGLEPTRELSMDGTCR
jgi:Tfp pilus assembly protein PilF